MDHPMDSPDFTDVPRRHAGTAVKIALVGAGLAVGAIGASAFAASATTTGSGTTAPSTSSTSSSSTSTQAPPGPGRPADRHGAAPVRSDEKEVTGADAATLKAAALKAVPGGTVYRIETDAGDGVYEAHMTKSDGTEVTVKFDKNLKVIKVESGMGQGDPAPH